MKRLFRLFLIFVVVVIAANVWIHWLYPTLAPESHAKWKKESDEELAMFKEDSRRADEKEAEEARVARDRLDAEIAVNKAKMAAEKVKREKPSYKKGADAGWDEGHHAGFAHASYYKFVIDYRGKRVEDDLRLQTVLDNKKANALYREAFYDAYVEGYKVGWRKGFKERDAVQAKKYVEMMRDLLEEE